MILDAARSGHYVKIDANRVEALERLLTANAEPSEEELTNEAIALGKTPRFNVIDNDPRYASMFYAGYIAGARREGRMAKSEPPMKRQTCHARDGECLWDECPQKTDEQPICVLAHRGGRR